MEGFDHREASVGQVQQMELLNIHQQCAVDDFNLGCSRRFGCCLGRS
jgi:hypothetical protein